MHAMTEEVHCFISETPPTRGDLWLSQPQAPIFKNTKRAQPLMPMTKTKSPMAKLFENTHFCEET